MASDDDSTARIHVWAADGPAFIDVEVPEDLRADDDARMAFCDGVAAGVTALLNHFNRPSAEIGHLYAGGDDAPIAPPAAG